MKKRNKGIIAVSIILFALAAICGFLFAHEYSTAKNEAAEYTGIQESYTVQEFRYLDEQSETPDIPGLPYKIVDYAGLLKINPETAGYLHIPYSPIDYPVLQTSNNNKYLNTSFTGEKSRAGAVFMDMSNNAAELDKNTILYAHHLKNRTDMFAALLEYNDQEYYELHQYIQFDTIYHQHGWWRVFAVINHDARSKDIDYLKLRFKDDMEFAEWISTAKSLSVYETGVTVSPDDKILTLSTCDRNLGYGQYGRQLVLAVCVGKEDI